MMRPFRNFITTLFLSYITFVAPAQADNRIDGQRPDAPALAAYGSYEVGTRPVEMINAAQIDIVAIDPSADRPAQFPTYDRPLTVQLWYPAFPGATGSQELRAFMRDGRNEVGLNGQGTLWAAPIIGDGPFPLVIVSHGYPGNRFLMSHLAENIASKGYIVASIDHTDSTYRTLSAFGSTLVNRTLDQLFVLNEMERINNDSSHFLQGLVDTSNTAVVGYSMGGYGALITAGAGVTQAAVDSPFGAPFGLLDVHLSGSDSHNNQPDSRIKTIVGFAPWGRQIGFFSDDTMQGISMPMMLLGGSVDDVSDYENGIRAAWQGATNSDRVLVTFDNANHNAGAPMPSPEEGYEFDPLLGFAPFEHYADAVWDNVRMNNISQHFVTAWLGKHLKNDAAMDAYLDLIPNSEDGVFSVDDDGAFTEDHTYWTGFANRTAKGLHFERLNTGE